MKEGWSQEKRRRYKVVFCHSCSRFFRCYGLTESAKREGLACSLWLGELERAKCVCKDCLESPDCIKGEKIQSLEELLAEEKKGNVVYPPADIFRKWKASSLKELWIKISEKL